MSKNTIEITAALSPEYQAAFQSAIDVVKRTQKELRAGSKELADLTKMQDAHALAAQARAEGDEKAAAKAQAQYDKLAAKMKMSGATIETVNNRMAALKKTNEETTKTYEAFAKKAQLQKVVKDLSNAQKAAQRFKDPAIQAEFRRQADAARALGVEVGTANAQLSRLSSASARVGPVLKKGFAIGIKGAAALAGGAIMAGKALYNMTGAYIDETADLAKTAAQYQVNTDSLQELRYAFGLARVGASDFDSGLSSLREKQDEAIEGSKATQKAFAALGISMEDLKNLNVEEVLMRTSKGLTALGDEAQTATIEKELFGGQGSAFAMVLKDFDAVLEGRDEAISKGVVLNAEQIAEAERAAQERFRLEQEMRANMQKIAAEIAPVIGDVMEQLNDWLRENPEVIKDFVGMVGDLLGTLVSVVRNVSAGVRALTGKSDVAGTEARQAEAIAENFAFALRMEGERHEILKGALADMRAGKTIDADEVLRFLKFDSSPSESLDSMPAPFGSREAIVRAGEARKRAEAYEAQRLKLEEGSSRVVRELTALMAQKEKAKSIQQTITIDARGAAPGEGARIAQAVPKLFRDAVTEALREQERLEYGK